MLASRVVYVCLALAGVLWPPDASAQPPAEAAKLQQEIEQLRQEFGTLRQQFDERLAALEAKLAAIQGTAQPPQPAPTEPAPAQPPAAPEGTPPAGSLPVYGAAAAASKIFNPDIAVIGDFLGTGGRNPVAPASALEMHESEASFQAIVDPYSRADFFMSFGEAGVELEEGYLTFMSLPGGLLTRVGKMRAAFGKVNTLHTHVTPWADRPIVINNLLAGEEGLSDAGVSVARLIPNPWLFLEATGQIFRGDSGEDLFTSSKPGDLAYVAHARGYRDISESTNIDLGVSYSRGHNAAGIVNGVDEGRFTTRLYGVDATVRWRPLRRSIYRSFIGRTEMVWSRRGQFGGTGRGMGYFASGDYQFARRWFAGARFDRSARAGDGSLIDKGGSLLLTFWPSEFSQVRGQYRRTAYGDAATANEFLVQFLFAIGAHGAHPF